MSEALRLQFEAERRIIDRIKARTDRLNLKRGSKAEKIALIRIANLVKNQAKKNIRANNQVDSGALLNSLKSRTKRTGDGLEISIAPQGIPYAAINEFGRVFTSRMRRAMFWNLAKSGKLGRGTDKNVIVGGRATKIYRARPYLRPALLAKRGEIIDILRETFQADV